MDKLIQAYLDAEKEALKNDPWKGYCAHDGCRYGLEGAFIET